MARGLNISETNSHSTPQSQSQPNSNPSRLAVAPSAPPPETNRSIDLKNVRFVVGRGDNASQPIPANITAINASESLRRLINENTQRDTKGNHVIQDVSESEFRQLIEFLEVNKLPFTDQNHRLQMFSVARQYNCPSMQLYCLSEVDANLDVSNVLSVYRTLWYYGSLTSHKDSLQGRCKRNAKPMSYSPDDFLTLLVYNVLQYISMHAECVLQQVGMDALSFKELEKIVKQDDLVLSSEMVLINALTRWGQEECRRKGIELTQENARTVLGEMIYAPR